MVRTDEQTAVMSSASAAAAGKSDPDSEIRL
jgi:hypothetical protein